MPIFIIDPVACAIRWIWGSASNMSASEWASWAQAIGTVVAIGAAWWQGSRGERRRDNEESKQRVIHYKIAEDIYRDAIEWRVRAIAALNDGSGRFLFDGGAIDYVEADLKILEKMLVLRLPNDRCSKDLQHMRDNTIGTRFDLIRARDEAQATNWENPTRALRLLLTDGRHFLEHAYKARGDDGPIDAPATNSTSRWDERARANRRLVEKLQAELGIVDQG